MPCTEQEVYDFLTEIYTRTKWPFVPHDIVKDKFGSGHKEALNLLREKGKIRKRQGFNKILIEIL